MVLYEFSCKGCDKRFPGCHSQCETYKQEKVEYDALKAAADKKRQISNGLTDQRNKALSKAMRGKRSTKKGNQ
jgi:hypothetical protein